MTAPHLALVPQSMIAAAREWLTRFTVGELSGGGMSQESPGEELDLGAGRLSVATTQVGEFVTETWCLIPFASTKLFGIFTESRHSEMRRRAVILLNAGATHHVGPNRMYVALARRWAEHGYLVLRIDLGGLGDSPPVGGQPENEVYPTTAVEEIRAAVEFMRRRYEITSIALGGLCSGAYHALRAAVDGVEVTRIIMVNPLNFFWQAGKTQNDLLRLGLVHNPDLYFRQNIPSRFWKKLFSGQVNIRRLFEIYVSYGFALFQWVARDFARALHLRLPRDLGNELKEVASRGIGIVFLFARGDPGIALLRHQAGSAVRRLEQHCRVHFIDGADHIFSQNAPRAELESLLGEELFARAAPAPGGKSAPSGSQFNQGPAE